MSQVVRVWYVQDRETGLFLAPHDGDVILVQHITRAGPFYDVESAIETAMLNLDRDPIIFSCFIEEK